MRDLLGKSPWPLALLTLSLALAASGCSSLSGGGRAVGELHLFGVSAPLNLDTRPGPDGVGVRLYASVAGGTEGIPIREGMLEVLMFDGSVSTAAARSHEPLKIWNFDAKALTAFEGKTSLGLGYQLALRWTPAVPRQQAVTIIARYLPPEGPEVWSTSNIVPLLTK